MTEFTAPIPPHAVLLPEISSDAYLVMTIEALEALETTYGPDYLAHCFNRLDTMTMSVVKTVAGHAVRGCTTEQLLAAMLLTEASDRLSDALSISINGRTVVEEFEHRQAKMKAVRDAAEAKANA